MLNLNYNINKALGGGGCIGVMKYNYSASIVVAGGGGGGSAAGPGGGGGGGMAVTQSISIIPNITYQINVGAGGAVGSDGQSSYLIGFDDNDNIPISFLAGGGKGTTNLNGGNSGTGSLIRAGVTTTYNAFTGGTGATEFSAFGLRAAGGGGASNQANGENGSVPSTIAGNGAAGVTSGGGGGYLGAGPTPPPPGSVGVQGLASSGAGIGGNGSSVNNPRAASAGSNGAVIISYTGEPKAFVTNASTATVDGVTTHRFNSGSGTFLFTYPYPWEDVVPYSVELCPPTYQ